MNETGFGHRSAALAIAAAMQDKYGTHCAVEIVNPFNDKRTPAILRNTQTGYDRAVQRPGLYRFAYRVSDMRLPNVAIESMLTIGLFQVIRDLIRCHQPHVIVTTHPHYLAPLDAAYAALGRHVPLITVVTDLTHVHHEWFHTVSDLLLVPTQAARRRAVQHGLLLRRVKITGIPVHPRLWQEQRPPAAIRAELGWQPDLPTVLVAGSKRMPHLADILHSLDDSSLIQQLVVVTGGDDALYRHLRQVKWRPITHLYNFVDNMPSLMRAADCIICKAGGLIVSEALACGLPILLVDVIEGQETGNANFVVSGGAGALARSSSEVIDILQGWFGQAGQLLAQHAQSARRLGRPQAAHEVAELVWTEAGRNPNRITENKYPLRFINLLDRLRMPRQEKRLRGSL